jgi:hypothetical protein
MYRKMLQVIIPFVFLDQKKVKCQADQQCRPQEPNGAQYSVEQGSQSVRAVIG